MAFRILALTHDNGESEDYNLNYTHFLIVSSDTLDFSESIFQEDGKRTRDTLIQHLKKLGYDVATQPVDIFELANEDEDEENDGDE